MEAKKIYNLISEEDFNDAKIINGNPSGIINLKKLITNGLQAYGI